MDRILIRRTIEAPRSGPFSTFDIKVFAMLTHRFALFAGCFFFVVTLSGWTHGVAQPPQPPTFEGATWKEALAKVPCQDVGKDGEDLKITAIIVVDGKSTTDPVLTKKDEVEPIEKRCFPKRTEIRPD
jgi:hypothetical protein